MKLGTPGYLGRATSAWICTSLAFVWPQVELFFEIFRCLHLFILRGSVLMSACLEDGEGCDLPNSVCYSIDEKHGRWFTPSADAVEKRLESLNESDIVSLRGLMEI